MTSVFLGTDGMRCTKWHGQDCRQSVLGAMTSVQGPHSRNKACVLWSAFRMKDDRSRDGSRATVCRDFPGQGNMDDQTKLIRNKSNEHLSAIGKVPTSLQVLHSRAVIIHPITS
ncbi:hypothetical protein KC359_g75 [Hortaea werneckii]|nr:hypothetical protein KC359_g75 [Hortaea werneckii]